jgi:UDP-4-amino-4,6-dideoxy-N-acetyl-beta-L-altrosamine transaminase
MKFLPYGRQHITEDDIEAVVKTLKSDFLTQGPAVESFEQAFCRKTGARYAVACSNGTAALHLAALASGISSGDEVLVPPVTFVASANCARFNGAGVIFADIDRNTLTLSPENCEIKLQQAKEKGRPIKAVVTVDLAGHPCDMAAFAELKKQYGFIWIQDACHSLGGAWCDKQQRCWKIGESSAPDMTVYSFHPVKHITCGEGGMITTHSGEYADKLRLYRTHGITKNQTDFVNAEFAHDSDGQVNPWYYEMQALGFNYRLTDIQAALGESQLKRLDKFIERRNQIVGHYRRSLHNLSQLSFPDVASGVRHAYHLAVVEIDFAGIGKSRATVMNELREKGIGTQVHYIPIPLMPYYKDSACMAEIPNSLDYYRKALSIPCFPQLSDEDVERVCQSIKEVIA